MTESINYCLEFFETHSTNTKKVESLPDILTATQWEGLTASKHSPGPVASNEDLLRLVINPFHVGPDGEVKPSLFSDTKDKGGSIQRLAFISRDDSITLGNEHNNNKNLEKPDAAPRSVVGTVQFSAQSVRDLASSTQARLFAIFDTALAENTAHGDICQLAITTNSPKDARSARLQLWELAEKTYQPIQT
jgi:hypothetical protein